MATLLGEMVSTGAIVNWPVVVLVLGILCLPSLRRVVNRARSIKVETDSVEIYLDPQGIHEEDGAITKIEGNGNQEDPAV